MWGLPNVGATETEGWKLNEEIVTHLAYLASMSGVSWFRQQVRYPCCGGMSELHLSGPCVNCRDGSVPLAEMRI